MQFRICIMYASRAIQRSFSTTPLPIPGYLLSPLKVSSCIHLKNRMVVAPLTRSRAGPSRLANDLMLEYYKQRSGFGLIVSEATAISKQGYGWSSSPALYDASHKAGWQKITDAVHANDGKIFFQAWHMGRQSHSSHQEGGKQIVSASAIAVPAPATMTTAKGETVPYELPRALETSEMPGVVEQYATSAHLAKDVGFDGIEIHGANGYLIDQFLQPVSNKRQDAYGGSRENRFRLLDEVVSAVGTIFPPERIAVRLSPNGSFGGQGSESNVHDFPYFASRLANRIGMLHVMDGWPRLRLPLL